MVCHLVYININLFPMFHYIVLNIIYICVCDIFVDIIICVLFVGKGQPISCDKFLSKYKRTNNDLQNIHIKLKSE